MAFIAKVIRTPASETSTLNEHLLSVMSRLWVKLNWTHYSGSIDPANIVTL